ncbi:hypothetical protein L249_1390 [Ophiocordyceps polyrhachis-furcata BCC 54312]|uniref:Xylanolytic transcriptional activator regulatory domain-containing protein n=1 Tax=Ophiocordyceps polyrhachis-furcata BCC 54312 TaxID=1330021 RepID=A0A367L478_9HYPO|nr:hypothetical protein L249_1390 [Ophiocordyceps polyrhachis-furcata BCC 54312]
MPASAVTAPLNKVKFVASDPSRGGLPVKRQQVQQACGSCRRKKRRCIHGELTSTDGSQPSFVSLRLASLGADHGPTADQPLPTPSQAPRISDEKGSSEVDHDDSNPRSSRFVGDLNPEGIFIEVTASASSRQRKGDVGIWLSSTGQVSNLVIPPRPLPIIDQHLLPFVREHCLSCLPPDADYTKIKTIYVDRMHPILPVVSVAALDGSSDSPRDVVLRQLVCLAASADPEAAPYLRLLNKGPDLLTLKVFSESLASAVRAVLETSLIPDRIIHIRALAMLSLYMQPTCAEEADLPAQLGGRAIHHVQTLGLQVLRWDAPDCDDDLHNLFCVVWALDRINAAVYGRPCLIHERDISVNLEACIRKRPPCFRLFLLIVRWLDQVIELYRPGPSAEASALHKVAHVDLPILEAMIVDADALKVPSSLIGTIETLYHAVIILSSRLPRPGTIPAAATRPPPSANARRSLAAERIARAVSEDQLSAMPFVPYAVSLALSVEYRKMRHSRLPMFRARAMNAFRRNCDLLRKSDDRSWNANVVAGLGERVLKEMERAATMLTKDTSPVVVVPDADSRPASVGGVGVEMAVADSALSTDFSLFDAILDEDVFSHIDPSFNLNAVEDALEANLDITLPPNWGDWCQFAS